jgi:YegS/Rv2252/BmrU family lipid kinase
MTSERPEQSVLLLNPAAAGGRVGRNRDELIAAVKSVLPEIEVVETAAGRGAADVAEEAIQQGATHVLSMGGDGTHSQVAGAIVRAQSDPGSVRFSPLPTGTGGDFSRLLHGDRKMAGVLKYAGEEGDLVDVGEVQLRGPNGNLQTHTFLNVASFGISGLVDAEVNRSSKRFGGKWAFAQGTLGATFAYTPAEMRLVVDGEPVFEGAIMNIAVCNGQYYGGGMNVAPMARLADGLLDVVVMPVQPLHRLLSTFVQTYRGTHVRPGGALHYRGRVVEADSIGGFSAFADIDGEPLGTQPFTLRVIPSVLRVTGLRGDSR